MPPPLHLLETTVLGDVRRFPSASAGLAPHDLLNAVASAVDEAGSLWSLLDLPPGVTDERWRHLAVTVRGRVRVYVLLVRQMVLDREAFVAVDVRLRRISAAE